MKCGWGWDRVLFVLWPMRNYSTADVREHWVVIWVKDCMTPSFSITEILSNSFVANWIEFLCYFFVYAIESSLKHFFFFVVSINQIKWDFSTHFGLFARSCSHDHGKYTQIHRSCLVNCFHFFVEFCSRCDAFFAENIDRIALATIVAMTLTRHTKRNFFISLLLLICKMIVFFFVPLNKTKGELQMNRREENRMRN